MHRELAWVGRRPLLPEPGPAAAAAVERSSVGDQDAGLDDSRQRRVPTINEHLGRIGCETHIRSRQLEPPKLSEKLVPLGHVHAAKSACHMKTSPHAGGERRTGSRLSSPVASHG